MHTDSLYWSAFLARVTALGLIAGAVFADDPVVRWVAIFLIIVGEVAQALFLRYTRRVS